MTQRLGLLLALCFQFSLAIAAPERPKLVVGIVIDQMRWDYLYKFQDRYGKKGFNRLLKDGFSFENCMLNYVPSYTAIGHSTIYTGSVPSIHGIAGNDFIDQKSGKAIYCTEDSKVKAVGIDPESKAGKMSPYNLKTTTITDQLRYATNFRSKVIGVSLKDRGSILPAGHSGNASYWFDSKTGHWITSTWYMTELPAWLKNYNDQKMPEKYLAKNWNPKYPLNTYKDSPENGNGKYEHGFKSLPIPSLPLNTSELVKEMGPGLIAHTPYGNTTTIDVAKLAIENEKLGQGKETDFLAVSFSAPDKIAHQFSVNSVFTEDTYLHLDEELGEFLSYLDKKIGKDEYLVFLTADHGGTPNALFMNEHKLPGSVWMVSAHLEALNKHLKKHFKEANLVRSLMNYQVHFNYPLIEKRKLSLSKIKEVTGKFVEGLPGVAYVADMKLASTATIPEVIREKIINGYNKDLSGEIQVILKPGWYEFEWGDPTKGGTHGTWTPDDAHIPFILMGKGIEKGSTNREVYMTDIAPTLASLLKIQMPSGSIGKSVYPVK